MGLAHLDMGHLNPKLCIVSAATAGIRQRWLHCSGIIEGGSLFRHLTRDFVGSCRDDSTRSQQAVQGKSAILIIPFLTICLFLCMGLSQKSTVISVNLFQVESVFLSARQDASQQQKKSHADFNEHFRNLFNNICLFDQGADIFDGEHTLQQDMYISSRIIIARVSSHSRTCVLITSIGPNTWR